ncbi:MAG: hypothetical protein QOK21_4009 [Solirubrobacteraceae bacterium]|jgi:uncharacterized membrane protein YidH (DUF202 family)|nr:hypothetical protein [Solirubrobacteraceae bacterium]
MPRERSTPPPQANERTALDWQRSSLSLGVIAAILLGHAVHEHQPGSVVVAAVLGAGGVWVGHLGRRLYQRRAARPQDPAVGPLATITAVTLLAALLAAVLVLVGTRA